MCTVHLGCGGLLDWLARGVDDAYRAAITRGAAMSYEQNLEYWISELGRLMDEGSDA